MQKQRREREKDALRNQRREKKLEDTNKRLEALAGVDQIPVADQHANGDPTKQKSRKKKSGWVKRRLDGKESRVVKAVRAQRQAGRADQHGGGKASGAKRRLLGPERNH